MVFPRTTSRKFRLGNISIYLKPCSSTNLQNWIFLHDRMFLYRFYHCVYGLEAWKKLSDVLEQHDAVITFDIAIFTQGKQIQMKFPEEFSNNVLSLWELHIARNYTCLWWVRSVVFFCVGFWKYFIVCSSDINYTICFNFFQQLNLSRYKEARSPACPQNVVDLLGSQLQRRFVIYQRFQWEDNEKNCEVHQM